jgi:hypothetical protein
MEALPTFRLLLIVALSVITSNAFPMADGRLMGSPSAASLRLRAPGSRELKPDQVNTAGWDKAWTNLVNDVEQSFRPSAPRLVAVEVELIVGNVGESQDDLTLSVKNAAGDELVSVTQVVKTPDCEHLLFLFPEGGVEVTPGDLYRIRLSGGTTFGWKYVVGGYPKGEATFNGKPLLSKARSTFLFRTFGSD